MIYAFGVDDEGNVPTPIPPSAFVPADPAAARKELEQAAALASERGTDLSKGQNPNCLADVGWMVLYAAGIDDAVKTELGPLIRKRRADVNDPPDRKSKRFQEFQDYTKGESAQTWLDRHAEQINTKKGVPYYLLIVGSPAEIPFDFQSELDEYFAVGRIWFETPQEYGNYARSVVEYEDPKLPAPTSRQIAFFAAQNGEDAATELLHAQLINPLLTATDDDDPVGHGKGFVRQTFLRSSATTGNLGRILRGEIPHGPPALLVTGTNGRKPSATHQDFDRLLGALICQEWPGPGNPVQDDHLFTADHVPEDARLRGMIAVMYACFGVGCPVSSSYSLPGQVQEPLATAPAISALPRRLLSHKEGGALAVLGHIDTMFLTSFQTAAGNSQDGAVRSILELLAGGATIGHATDRLNLSWSGMLRACSASERAALSDDAFETRWISAQDGRNFTIFGDPAVRLRVADMEILEAAPQDCE